MLTLRLTQHAKSQGNFNSVEVALEGEGNHQSATVDFEFKLTLQDQEDLRWYLEDYLQFPFEPAPQIATRIEQRMAEIGVKLFRDIFHGNDDARNLWSILYQNLNNTRVEIVTEMFQTMAIPWELLHDPGSDIPLVLQAAAFVYTYANPSKPASVTQVNDAKVRILLVICRPKRSDDIPFRSVATKLIRGLTDSNREVFQLDVLRPPSFDQLGCVLRAAKESGHPYHIVHFDGHGIYVDLIAETSGTASDPRKMRGYLIFENPNFQGNQELVPGGLIGNLLKETDVSLLVLNACRSAHTEFLETPAQIDETTSDQTIASRTLVRAFGSLAQEVMNAGITGIVAMRYNIYVTTAAQFVANLYANLVQGQTLGEAVTLGRKQLAAQPQREIGYKPISLQDWLVPVVYESAPIALFPSSCNSTKLTINLQSNNVMLVAGRLDPQLSRIPDIGFFGRDETLLAIDRAFNTHSIVLLYAYAGSGKTSAVTEFARWYTLTKGITGPAFFTSFERYIPLPRVLDKLGQVFERELEASGICWLALSDAERRQVALQVLAQVPVLWIWDNVEPVAGFPSGAKSTWSVTQQQELADFLKDAVGTKAKFLLTSRRDEQGWLGELPQRISMPPMPIQERVQLARAEAEKGGHRLTVEDWRLLLEFSLGNPLTITVLVRQALYQGLRTSQQIEDFVSQLRAGEATIDDEESEGRSKSLGRSLSYGFKHSFRNEEQKQLALLYFFQGFVDARVFCYIGDPDFGNLQTINNLSFSAAVTLLDRAAEVGLLTALGKGCYTIHPALPWYFKNLLNQYYQDSSISKKGEANISATQAFVKTMARLGNFYNFAHEQGHSNVIWRLIEEEASLLYAWQLARTNCWWGELTEIMEGLDILYAHTGSRSKWARLVSDILPVFLDPISNGPMPGCEDRWSLVTGYQVGLLREARQLAEAEQLQRTRVDWHRRQTVSILSKSLEMLDEAQRNLIDGLARSIDKLGYILRDQNKPDCVKFFEEAAQLSQSIKNHTGEAISAFNLGQAYKDIPVLRNLTLSEYWYHRSLELRNDYDRHGQAKSLSQLGMIAYELFEEARAAKQSKEDLIHYLNIAVQRYYQAIAIFPPDAVNDLGAVHLQLGNIYCDMGDLSRSLTHYLESLRKAEIAEDVYGAALARFNISLNLYQVGRFEDAQLYAQAALSNYETFGDPTTDKIQKTRKLIELIEQSLKP